MDWSGRDEGRAPLNVWGSPVAEGPLCWAAWKWGILPPPAGPAPHVDAPCRPCPSGPPPCERALPLTSTAMRASPAPHVDAPCGPRPSRLHSLPCPSRRGPCEPCPWRPRTLRAPPLMSRAMRAPPFTWMAMRALPLTSAGMRLLLRGLPWSLDFFDCGLQ